MKTLRLILALLAGALIASPLVCEAQLSGDKPENYSDRVWGDLDRCTLAAIVTPQMISQRPK